MPDADTNAFLHHIRHLIGTAPAVTLSDGQLLEQFLSGRDESAVEVLVRRYGPLVLGVCRRVLHNAHAAEDAFQATFLILLRKAAALDRGKPLGSWLYTVAYRLSLTARANQLRRQRCEEKAARRTISTPPSSDLEVALEEELQRLPEKYRTPLVLCYLEGKTNEQAAQILCCPVGSMSARLDQARQRLRESLERRGFTVPAAGIGALLSTAVTEAAVPLPLLCNTVRAAVWFAGEQATGAGLVSSAALALARGGCRATLLHKVRVAAAVLLMSALLGTGATMLLKAAPPERIAGQPGLEVAEERLPAGAVARLGTTRLRHGDAVFFAACTPDGTSLITAGRDRTLRLWDLASGREIRRFAWPEAAPDGKAASSENNPFERHEQQVLDDLALGSQAALSSDGTVVAASRGGVVCLWQTATGKHLHRLQTGQKQLVHLAFSADGKSLLTLGPGARTFAVWEVATGKCVRSRQVEPPPGYGRGRAIPINEQHAVVSPGWKYLAYQWRDATSVRYLRIRELATGKELPPIHSGGYGGTLAFCFTADEKTLLWDDWYQAGGVVFSDVRTGRELRRLGDRRQQDVDRTEETLAIALSPDGRSVAVCRQSHTIELWDLTTGKSTFPAGKPTLAQLYDWFPDFVGTYVRPALTFSPDGKRLISSLGGAAIRQFHAATGREIPGPGKDQRAAVNTLVLAADGKSLGTFGTGEPLRFWEPATGKLAKQSDLPPTATHVAFADEGQYAFAVGNRVTLRGKGGPATWKLAAAEYPPLQTLALSPDGTLLATRHYDYPEVKLWDATGKQRRTLGRPGEGPTFLGDATRETAGVVTPDVVFSPDGRCLAGAGPRRQLCLWDVATGSLLWEVPPRTGEVVERFAFSPGGHTLASVHADGTVTLYETAGGARRARLGEADKKKRRVYLAYNYYGKSRLAQTTRRAAPVCLAFSPDSRYLAVAQDTPLISLWDVLAGRRVARLQGHEGGVVSLLFSGDGKYLFSGGCDTTVLTWDLTRLLRAPATRAALLSAAEREMAWADLANRDAARAFTAIRRLCASPEQALALIKERVRPATPADPARLVGLLADLQSDRFERRRQAASELERLGESAQPAVLAALANDPPLELRQRLERLLSRSRTGVPGGQLRDLRAVEVLERIGSPGARQLLHRLAAGVPGSRLTQHASSAGRRLDKQRP